MNPFREFLLWLSGANRHVLERCPSEETKFIGVGGAVLTTAVLAFAAATTTLAMILRVPLPVAAGIGFLWGVAILNLDRWLVASTRRQDTAWRNVIIAIPRLCLALIIGIVIAEPLVLAVFDPEIKPMAVELQQDAEAARKKKLDEDYAQIGELRKRRGELRKELTTLDAGSLVATNPRRVALASVVTSLEERRDDAEKAVICEVEGKQSCGSGREGRGPAYREKKRRFDELTQQLGQKRAELAALDTELARDEAPALKDARLAREAELARVERDLEAQQADHAAAVAEFETAKSTEPGLLDRIDALDRLSEERAPLAAAHWVLRLFILALDSLPVLVKLFMTLGKPSLYDLEVDAYEEAVLASDTIAYEKQREAASINASIVVDEATARRVLEVETADEIAREIVAAQRELATEYISAWKAAAAHDMRSQLIDLRKKGVGSDAA